MLLQIVNNVAPVLDLPVWIARAFLILLVIGFPITLLAVWARELAPADGTAGRPGTGKLDWTLIGALVIVIALVSYQQLAPSPGTTASQQASAASSSSQPQSGGISIVVLPFANVSGDSSREFFSDGMTDEISGALAKVPDLRVIARGSAFQFKGQNQDVRAVGQAVGASHLIEGSVRQAGNRVRITAQLVRAGDGVQLWSENYDRELTDIFAIQEEIAEAIAGALRAPLGLQRGERLVSSRTDDLDSYQQFLRARALLRERRNRGGRPSGARASAKALASVDLANLDLVATLKKIAGDSSAPANARVSAIRTLLKLKANRSKAKRMTGPRGRWRFWRGRKGGQIDGADSALRHRLPRHGALR